MTVVDQYAMRNPLDQYPRPDFEAPPVPYPGDDARMKPKPDYGATTYRGSGRLTGRRAIVTGGDSGIGRAVALAFAREGAHVLIAHLPAEADDARQTLDLISGEDVKAVAHAGDLRDDAARQELIARAIAEFGGVDILVNNAAYQQAHESGIEQTDADEFDRTMKTNVYAPFFLVQAALPHLEPGSCIINTASVEAYQPQPGILAYALTKGAMTTFTKGLALQVLPRGIRVNAVAPGPVWTPLIPATMSTETVVPYGKEDTPMGRPAQPAELAPAYVYLASQESSFVTGQILGVTGGKVTN